MIKTGSEFLDEFLKGYRNEVHCIYGEGATGKTTICIQVSANLAKLGKKVLYIDTENGFSTERFKQIAGPKYLDLLDNIFILKVKDFRDQYYKVKNLVELSNFDFLIIDTVGFYYRKEVKLDKYKSNNMLKHHFDHLYKISKKGVPVIVANQVYARIDSTVPAPVGGNIIVPNCDVLIRLEKDPRKIILMKPYEDFKYFKIDDSGIISS